MKEEWEQLNGELIACRACPRLVKHRERIAVTKRRAYADQEYWGKPVPGFGDRRARLLIVGLAPGAHGSNRTGRMFTGDASGHFLYASLHTAQFASQPTSLSADDGLQLTDCFITAAARCAPPANKPTTKERDLCRQFLERELDLLEDRLKVVVALGLYGYDQILRILRDRGWGVPVPKPKFGHAVEFDILRPEGNAPLRLIGCYHPSQQNTFTGKLTADMLDTIFLRGRELLSVV